MLSKQGLKIVFLCKLHEEKIKCAKVRNDINSSRDASHSNIKVSINVWPNPSVKKLAEIVRSGPDSFNQMLMEYGKRFFIDGLEYDLKFIDNGDRIIGKGDTFYIISKEYGKTKNYFMDHDLDAFSAQSINEVSDYASEPSHEDMKEYGQEFSMQDRSLENKAKLINKIYIGKISKIMKHLKDKD